MITKDLNICLYPMTIEWDNIQANLDNLEKTISQVQPGTDLLVLPETFTTGFPTGKVKEDIVKMIDKYQEYTISLLKYLAGKHNLAICGSVIYHENDNLYNRAIFVEPNGDITNADKRHLFSMAGEDKIFKGGNNRLKIRYRSWNISMIVCYDLRFPIWSRNVENEYDLLIVVANWPEVRISAWNKLLPARAIENQAYLCGVDCMGTDPSGFKYDGSSAIIDYKGNEIGKNDDSANNLIYATLSREKIESFRSKFPAWKDADKFRIL